MIKFTFRLKTFSETSGSLFINEKDACFLFGKDNLENAKKNIIDSKCYYQEHYFEITHTDIELVIVAEKRSRERLAKTLFCVIDKLIVEKDIDDVWSYISDNKNIKIKTKYCATLRVDGDWQGQRDVEVSGDFNSFDDDDMLDEIDEWKMNAIASKSEIHDRDGNFLTCFENKSDAVRYIEDANEYD